MYEDIAPRQAVWVRQTAAVGVLRSLVEALGPSDLLPVKGIVTARTLYDDPADRPLADLDVRLASPAELPRVLAFAAERGHAVRKFSKAYANVVIDAGGVELDVECRVGPPGLSGLTVGGMLARAALRDDVFGFPCKVPELHDHALLLCINAFKDKLVLAAPWSVEDLVRIGQSAAFDPERLARLARASGSAALTWIVADWLADRSPAWRAVREALGPSAPRPLYCSAFRWVIERSPTSLAARLLARTAADGMAPRVRAVVHAAVFELRELRR